MGTVWTGALFWCEKLVSTDEFTGTEYLLSNPVDRCRAGGQQLAGIGLAALARPAIANAGHFQVRFMGHARLSCGCGFAETPDAHC